MTRSEPHPQPEYTITKEELLIVEHGCIYPDTDECVGKRCKYHDPNPVFRENIVCLLNEHDVADKVRSRTNPPAPEPWCYPGCMLVYKAKEQARKAGREQVLDEALAEFQNINAPPVRVTYIRHVLESLRQQEGKP